MSVQEKKDFIIKRLAYLSDAEIELLYDFVIGLQTNTEDDKNAQKIFDEVNAKYGNVLAKLAL